MDIEKEFVKFNFTDAGLELKVLASSSADKAVHERVYLTRTLTKSQTKEFINHLKSICDTYDRHWSKL